MVEIMLQFYDVVLVSWKLSAHYELRSIACGGFILHRWKLLDGGSGARQIFRSVAAKVRRYHAYLRLGTLGRFMVNVHWMVNNVDNDGDGISIPSNTHYN